MEDSGISVPLPMIQLGFLFIKTDKGDEDNFAVGMKHWVDGLVVGGLIIDDSPQYVHYGENGLRRPEPENGETFKHQTVAFVQEIALPSWAKRRA